MDATSVIIILLFVVSIVGSSGNKGYSPPTASAPETISTAIYSSVEASVPAFKFDSNDETSPAQAIKRFIRQYRSEELADSIARSIVRHSQALDLNPKLIAALIARESKFNPRALSSSGAAGLGQLLPSTAKNLGVEEPYDIDQNAKGTATYFKYLLDRFKGRVPFALAAYLEGPNAVDGQAGFSLHTKSYVEDILNIYQRI